MLAQRELLNEMNPMAPFSAAELVARIGDRQHRFPLGDAPCRIGRAEQSTIVFANEMVSRNHAMIQAGEGGFFLYDLGSRNGTFLNGRRLTVPAALQDGDVIGIGDSTLVFTAARVQPAAPGPMPHHGASTVVTVAARMITVVVMDIRGFTVLARQLGETRIAQLIGAFNSDTGAILEKAGTLTLSYIGDAVMAIWEHKLTRTPQAILAGVFRSIHAVHGVVDGLQARFGLPQPVRIGVGINSGLASVGNMGSGGTSDFTAMGDVVNKAFRLESSTRHLDADVAFSDEVRDILGASVVQAITQVHRVELKGYAELCTVYAMPMRDVTRVTEMLESPAPTRAFWDLETTL